jgi:competence ComEA-like helix-hairpin-helix protein
MTTMEGRGLIRGALVLLALSLVRFGLSHLGAGDEVLLPGQESLTSLMAESEQKKDEAARRSAPLAPNEKLDPNRDCEEELDRLPGIGPALAQALVRNREEEGGYAGKEDLLRVPGIGPAKLERMIPYLDFSKGMPLELHRRTRDRGELPPGGRGPGRVGRAGPPEGAHGSTGLVDLNRSTSKELETLPGIGPALAERILESRRTEGPFGKLEDLLRIQGIGPVIVDRINGLVVF